MSDNPWKSIKSTPNNSNCTAWICSTLTRNAGAAYLKQFGSPATVYEFRKQVPLCSYEDLEPFIKRLIKGERDVLFSGLPIAFERTGGSTGGTKLIPYSQEGLLDFQHNILPWLVRTVREYSISGRVYFSISPATRKPKFIGSVPVGLPDSAYLGDKAGSVFAMQTAIPLEVGNIQDVAVWRKQTLMHLMAAEDLELISIWSPTFLLGLIEDIPDPQRYWPKLKVVSCWASGSSLCYAKLLKQKLPHVVIQPKGLLSTEAVVTVPEEGDRPVLVRNGFFEFANGGDLLLENELSCGSEYEVIITTASGLYRYRTGDRVRFEGYNANRQAILEFVGRDSLVSDLVGEKLTEAFVSSCLEPIPEMTMLVPNVSNPGYIVVCSQQLTDTHIAMLEERLKTNPQYAYARKLGQLAPIKMLVHKSPFSVIERTLVDKGTTCMGDVKPVALRKEAFWLPLFLESSK